MAVAENLIARHEAPPASAAWAASARDAARARLLEMGGPVRRDEYWRYTDPALLVDGAPKAGALDDDAAVFEGVDALRLVFVDGAFRADLSDDMVLEHIEIQPLTEALSADIHWARGVFGALEAAGQTPVPRPLAALNTAAAAAGFMIRITGKPARPISFSYLH
ncbi:MAG: Fe-S cluster assembly protein SufD, partial [Paracoccaceae bacterium]